MMGHNVFLSALAYGVPLVVQARFDVAATLDLIEAHGVTYFSDLGEMYERLVDAPSFAPERVKTLSKGAVAFVDGFDEAAFERMEEAVGFPLVQPYGLSEVNSQVFVGDLDAPLKSRRRVCGPLVFPEAEDAKVVDPETGANLSPASGVNSYSEASTSSSSTWESPQRPRRRSRMTGGFARVTW